MEVIAEKRAGQDGQSSLSKQRVELNGVWKDAATLQSALLGKCCGCLEQREDVGDGAKVEQSPGRLDALASRVG